MRSSPPWVACMENPRNKLSARASRHGWRVRPAQMALALATTFTLTACVPTSSLRVVNKDTALQQTAAALASGVDVEECVKALCAATPPHLHYTAAALRANHAAAADDGDVGSWVAAVNEILGHWKTSSIRLLTWGGPGLPRTDAGGGIDDPGASSLWQRRQGTERLTPPAQPAMDFVGSLAPALPAPGIARGPLVSVIMVAHNAEATLAGAIASILAQSWRRLELIVVDDASTDATGAVITDMQAGDARIRLVRNRARVGPYVSRNVALRDAVRGEYVTCHDADDWAHPDRLVAQVQPLIAPGSTARANVAYMLRIRPSGELNTAALSWFCPDGVTRVAMVSAMYERRLLTERLGYWDAVWYGGDAEMIGRAQALLGPGGFVELPVISMLCRDRAEGLGKAGYADAARDRWTNSTRYWYREAFTAWHNQIAAHGAEAFLPFYHQGRRRKFVAADSMLVPDRRVRALTLSAP